MEIEFFGGNCFRVKSKKATIVVDDNLDAIGGTSVVAEGDVVFYSSRSLKSGAAAKKAKLVIDSAGEYEIGDISVKALQARAHMDGDDEATATVIQFMFDNQTVTVLGHVHPDVDGEVIEMAGGTDVLVVPVGGNGYTLDATGAASLIKKIEPDNVIPAHYDMDGLTYEVPAAPLDDFIKVSGMTMPEETSANVALGKLPSSDGGQTTLVVMSPKKK